MTIAGILDIVERQSPGASPLVVFAATWPLAVAFRTAPDVLARSLCDGLRERFEGRTILMPTFTAGFDADGVCNLDSTASSTGLISETLRLLPGSRRTRSAFFSFAVQGPERDAVVALSPRESWGEGSLYAWMHEQDARIVTIGVHPTHCSYTHYAEWLYRDHISYRHPKPMSGRLVHEGRELPHEEILFVRQRNPSPINDFTWLLPHYLAGGMQVESLQGISVSAIGARDKIAVIDPWLQRDPFALLQNKELFLSHV